MSIPTTLILSLHTLLCSEGLSIFTIGFRDCFRQSCDLSVPVYVTATISLIGTFPMQMELRMLG